MDPISAAASIVGLLSAASKTSELLAKFVRRARSAPTLAKAVLSEVSDISACLSQLQRYLLGSKATSRSHDDLLSLEQIVVALSNCVLIFSELEEAIDFLKKEDPMRTIQIARWLWKEQDIRLLLSRLKSSQVSLNLMLTTMTCTSSAEARCSVDKLGIMVQQVLESNHRDAERAKARDAIMDEIVEAFRWASRNINALSSNGYFVPVNSELRRVLDFATTNGEFSQSHRLQCYRALKTMWQNAEVRENLMCTEKTVMNDNIPFIYMDNIDEIATNVVSDESLLRMRSNTMGIYNQPIMIDDVQCQIVDAGHTGVKWPDCSQALDSVIYVASLIDCYEQSSEGGTTNKMKELLANFELLTKMEEMRMVPIILLLNKADILESKLKEEPISDDHGWPFSDYMSACRHFSNEFARLDKRPNGALRIQVTSAIDRIVFEKTLEIIKPIIIGNEKKHPLGRREISNPIFVSSTSKQDTIDLPSPSSHGLGYGSSKKRHEDVGNTITPPRSRDVSEEIHHRKLYGKSLVRRSSNILSAHPLLRSRAA